MLIHSKDEHVAKQDVMTNLYLAKTSKTKNMILAEL